jgi:hypothetical protein
VDISFFQLSFGFGIAVEPFPLSTSFRIRIRHEAFPFFNFLLVFDEVIAFIF